METLSKKAGNFVYPAARNEPQTGFGPAHGFTNVRRVLQPRSQHPRSIFERHGSNSLSYLPIAAMTFCMKYCAGFGRFYQPAKRNRVE